MDITRFRSLPFYLKLACSLFSLMAFVYIAIVAKEIISPIIFACLFSILLLPLASFFERKMRMPRSLASMLAVVCMVAGIALVLYLIGAQVSGMSSDWPQFKEQLQSSIHNLQDWISATFQINARKQMDYVNDATDKMMSSGSQFLGITLLSISSIILFLVFVFIYTFFFLLYRSLILRFLEAVFQEANRHIVHDILERVQYMVRKYIIGLLLEMCIVFALVCLAFLALGVKYAFLLALLTALFNIIPYIGIFTALLVSTMITFATSAVATKVIMVIVVLIIIHLIDSNILLPLIVGSKVRINALITVLGVVIGEMIWGVSGMFLSIPVIAVIKIIFDRVHSLQPWGIILGDEEKKKEGRKQGRMIESHT